MSYICKENGKVGSFVMSDDSTIDLQLKVAIEDTFNKYHTYSMAKELTQ